MACVVRWSSECCGVGAAILFTISVLWYWGSKRKVMALDSQKVLLADLFRVKHPADEDDRYAAALPAPVSCPGRPLKGHSCQGPDTRLCLARDFASTPLGQMDSISILHRLCGSPCMR